MRKMCGKNKQRDKQTEGKKKEGMNGVQRKGRRERKIQSKDEERE